MSQERETRGDQLDAQTASADEPKSPTTILEEQISEALNELHRPSDGLFLSGLSAGLDIGFGPLLMAVLLTLVAGEWGTAVTEIALANAYAIGFIFVILARSELFTEHTTLAVLPVIDRRASLRQLGRLWGIIWGANVLGGAIFAVIMVLGAPEYGIATEHAFAEIAKSVTDHSLLGLFVGAIFAGWLMGLLSWLVTAAQETISRVFFVWAVTATIGIAHLPHSIAGNVEVLAGLFVVEGISVLDYGKFLVLATIGNAIGGTFFVALLKYGHVVRGGN